MKANDFVKKFGWNVAIKLSNEMTGITQDVADCVACWGQSEWDYLKRLIESHELVESYGGLENAKHEVFKRPSQVVVKQAISDVESCQ